MIVLLKILITTYLLIYFQVIILARITYHFIAEETRLLLLLDYTN